MTPRLAPPWLEVDFGREMRVLSWAPHRPGLVSARRILWREVRNEDLPEGFDAEAWLAAEIAARGDEAAVGFLTSRSLARFETAGAAVEGVSAVALATVGLSNAERVGARRRAPPKVGTINLLVALDAALTEAALIEALSIAVQARTAAVLAAGIVTETGAATGTGTDCVAIAAPVSGAPLLFAGLHTAAGEAIGRAAFDAVAAGAARWRRDFPHGTPDLPQP